jgi:hypothetical protein
MPVDLLEGCLRWGARGLSVLVFVFLLGELFGDHAGSKGPTPSEWAQLGLFPIGMAVGLAIGWKWEVPGGAVAVSCLALFYVLHRVLSGGFPRGPWFLIFTIPGFMFLIAGLLDRAAYSRSG